MVALNNSIDAKSQPQTSLALQSNTNTVTGITTPIWYADTNLAFTDNSSQHVLSSTALPPLSFFNNYPPHSITFIADIKNPDFTTYSDAFGTVTSISAKSVAPVPEASTTASLGLLLALGMGGIVIAAKRNKASGKSVA